VEWGHHPPTCGIGQRGIESSQSKIGYKLIWAKAETTALQGDRFAHSLEERLRNERAMLANSEVERILEALPFSSEGSELVEEVLKRVVCCPICKELFSRSDDLLTEHLRRCHADRLVSSGSKQITDHCVQEGSDTIYICPHCRFAVGAGSHIYEPNPVSTIVTHVRGCRCNLPARGGPVRVSYFESEDVKLIEAYRRNCAEIELFVPTGGTKTPG